MLGEANTPRTCCAGAACCRPTAAASRCAARRWTTTALGERCNVLYLGLLDEAQRRRAFAGVAGHPVLSLSEHDPDCSVGSVFCLDFSAAPPSFAVNLDSVAHSGVRVHPNVLNLGRRRGQP